MVTRLSRALKGRSTHTQRMTCTVIGNLVKLVRDPTVAEQYLGPPGQQPWPAWTTR
jgi:elongation factor 3